VPRERVDDVYGQLAVDDVGWTPALGRDEARALTEQVKADAQTLWAKLKTLYDVGTYGMLRLVSGTHC
jgi:hypothetical protein